jgi:peroxiredoxin
MLQFSNRGCSIVTLALLFVLAPLAHAGDWEFPKDWFWHDDDAQRAKHEPLLGKPMPALDLSDWKNKSLAADDMKGKVLVVHFWPTWCGPCIASIPHNNARAAKYKDKGVLIIGVCTSKQGQEKFEQVVANKGIKYPAARDKDCTSEQAWNVMWYPTYAVVDQKGNVRAIGLKPEHVEDVVDKILSEGKTASAR